MKAIITLQKQIWCDSGAYKGVLKIIELEIDIDADGFDEVYNELLGNDLVLTTIRERP